MLGQSEDEWPPVPTLDGEGIWQMAMRSKKKIHSTSSHTSHPTCKCTHFCSTGKVSGKERCLESEKTVIAMGNAKGNSHTLRVRQDVLCRRDGAAPGGVDTPGPSGRDVGNPTGADMDGIAPGGVDCASKLRKRTRNRQRKGKKLDIMPTI